MHYFGPSKFYCVETICASCGVVIAWTKFDKSESPTNILKFLESVYPTEESQPAYICIDKACQVLQTAVSTKVEILGRKLLVSLWIHITISIIAQQTFFVINGVILALWMAQH